MAKDNDAKSYEGLAEIFRHYIESFDYMADYGLKDMLRNIKPVEVIIEDMGSKLKISLENPKICHPQKKRSSGTMAALYPVECRQAKLTYAGNFTVDIVCEQRRIISRHLVARQRQTCNLGKFPIMLKSKLCHLREANDPKKLVLLKEEPSEMGGYFITDGIERVGRLLILPKRNYPMSMVKNSFRERRKGYTDKAIVIRCVRQDQSAVTVTLYYLHNGGARLGFCIQGTEYLLPVGVILKALTEATDREISTWIGERAIIISDELYHMSLFTSSQCLQHIGKLFQTVTGHEEETLSDVGHAIINDYIFVHLSDNIDKLNLLILMLQKLFSLVDQTSLPDNPDSLQNQEVLLPGHLIAISLKEKLQDWLLRVKKALEDKPDTKTNEHLLSIWNRVKKVVANTFPEHIGVAIQNMLKTGCLATRSGLDLQQRVGMTVMADRSNFLNFISHFRAVHRGASFAGLRSLSVRKLLPESWGFLCPAHTPDGELCGLLNHMTSSCRLTSYYDSEGNVKDFLKIRSSLLSIFMNRGMRDTESSKSLTSATVPLKSLYVILDGCILGSLTVDSIEPLVHDLRRLKVSTASMIPEDLEVGYVPFSMGGAYPGLYLFTSASRFVRPVRNNSIPSEESNNIELIGPFEQVYMEISCPDGGDGGRKDGFPATHEEIHPTGILSVVGNLTPWSNHNQSLVNMYQCQMAKQTMGFSCQSVNSRADKKLYHLETPQAPIVRTKAYEKYNIHDSPQGTNAIVAVLAYSGYDMSDAIVLNKSSVERGMCRGCIYQTETIDLTEQNIKSGRRKRSFFKSNLDESSYHLIASDGLPFVGQRISRNDPYCSIHDGNTKKITTHTLKGSDHAYVDYVAVDGKNEKDIQKANIRFRQPRNPEIGDKFSSRHGQKGVCSQFLQDADMPFSGISGMRPDLIINPHGFPSRMPIAMLLESIAAKGGALHGKFMDATPFAISDTSSLVDELGCLLVERKFNYHGLEVLYSGVYGTELTCEIFTGPVYFQRLRHMVLDKFQVRSTGITGLMTRQPAKETNGVAPVFFGEMERDSLLAHGAAYLLHDRLHMSSDYHVADVCSLCGSIQTTIIPSPKRDVQQIIAAVMPRRGAVQKVACVACQTSKGMTTVAMPYVFRFLSAELAAMNIKMALRISR